MDGLIYLILSLSTEKFEQFLKAKQMLKVDEQRDILRSLLFFKAVENDFLFEDLVQFPDPILTYIEKFNSLLNHIWCEKAHSPLAEENRLDVTVALLRDYFSEDLISLKQFKNKLEILLNFYMSLEDNAGYLVNALTSLMIASTYLIGHFSSNDKTEKTMSLIVATLQEQQIKSEEFLLEVNKINKMINIYCEQFSKEELKLVGLLHELDKVSQNLRMMENFIRIHIVASFLGVYSGQISAEQFFLISEQINNALYVYQDLLLLKVCIYDKGKNAIGRLQLFCSVFKEQDENAVGDDKLDAELRVFKNDMNNKVTKIKCYLDYQVPQAGLVQRLWSYVSTYMPSTTYFYAADSGAKQIMENKSSVEAISPATMTSYFKR